ncbi:MAG TPA: tRNA guanosine(34) transglycosylase Tgt [Candidatus Saccharimonadales bacterium]|nr:tRNA guanosine(34) transglycosylase Tgt [Candidatus Saccharimonadales bacterium]
MKFNIKSILKGSLARTGILELPHGTVQTPAFMPVGTQGIVKTLAPWEMEELGAEIILGNTYHLHLRPGEDLIAEAGGLNEWSEWSRPILTDSGGYQAYSLGETRAKSAKTTNDGVKFYSPYDGSAHFFTPESVLDIQAKIGSDIVMPLDDCPPIEATEKRVESAVIRTGEWAKRSIDHWQKEGRGKSEKMLFGIIQGGLYENLRLRSMNEIQALPFDGIAVGGVAIASEGKDKINKAVDYVAKGLDPLRPHYLMGVGYPEDLIRAVHQGFDMFDCVLPTRLARHGSFWTTKLTQHDLKNAQYRTDSAPLDPDCHCKICQNFSKSYLRHLLISQETFALRALSYHNLSVVLNLMKNIRASIEDGSFLKRYQKYLG